MNRQELQNYVNSKYPETLQFDVDTLQPKGALVERMHSFEEVSRIFFKGGSSFLDIGCNKGYFEALVLKENPSIRKIVAIDILPEVLEVAESLCPSTGVQFELFSFQKYPIERVSFDRIFWGNGPHYGFTDCVGSWDFLAKLAVLSTGLVLLEGGFDFGDPEMKPMVKDAWEGQFSVKAFNKVARRYFEIVEIYLL